MAQPHTFYSGLDIHAAEAIDKRFYIDSLTSNELKRVFGSDGRYGFSKSFVFNKSLNKFQYLSTYIAKSDVIEVSNWLTIESDGAAFIQYNSNSSYTIGNSVWFENSSNVTGFFIALGVVNTDESPESHPNKWLNISSGGSTGTVISGTPKKLAKFNTAGDNVENSAITEDANVLIEKSVVIDSLVQNDSGLTFKNLKADPGLLAQTSNTVNAGQNLRCIIEKNGIVYTTSYGDKTLKMIANGVVTHTVNFDENPNDVIYATDGNLYVSCNDYDGHIYKVTLAGVKTLLCTTGRIYPNCIFQGNNGKLYVLHSYNTDFTSGSVVQVELNGTVSAFTQVADKQLLRIVQKTNNNNFYIVDNSGTIYEVPSTGGAATVYYSNSDLNYYTLMKSTTNNIYIISQSSGIYRINSGSSTLLAAINFDVLGAKIVGDVIYFNDYNSNFYKCTLSGIITLIGENEIFSENTETFCVNSTADKFYFQNLNDNLLYEFIPTDSVDLIAIDKNGKVLKSIKPIDSLKISKSKNQINNLIDSSKLIPGSLYEISGVENSLYNDGTGSGTTILLQALSENTLSKTGHGIFWNPKYSQNLGFGIWTNRGTWISNNSVIPINLAGTGTTPNKSVIDSSGNIYTANFSTNNVTKITPDGVSTIHGTTGSGPLSLTIDSLNNIYTINSQNNNVTKITPDGVSTIFGGVLPFTSYGGKDIAIDSNDNLYIADFGDAFTPNTGVGNVIMIESNGTSSILGSPMGSPRCIIVDSNDNVYTGNWDGTITLIETTGTISIIGSIADPIQAMNIDSNNDFFVTNTDTNKLYKITQTGVTTLIGSTDNYPVNIIIDSNDNVYIANLIGNSIQKVSNGTITSFASINRPSGLVFNLDQTLLYVTDISMNRLYSVSTIPPIQFITNENVTSDNGATGKLIGDLVNNKFEIISGDWSSSTLITGDISGATASISDVIATNTSINSNIIWGGYSWKNLTGNIGSASDEFNLSNDWVKNPYSDVNYNKVFDIIEYDYNENRITRRFEISSGNDVNCTKTDANDMGYESPIKFFQFGNPYRLSDNLGMLNCKIYNSTFSNINFVGNYMKHIKLENHSVLRYSTWDKSTSISYLTMDNSIMLYLNLYNNSKIEKIKMTDATFNYLEVPAQKNMINLIFEPDTYIDSNDTNFLSSSLIFNKDWLATVYGRPDGTVKMRYYDNDDALVINDIDDTAFD